MDLSKRKGALVWEGGLICILHREWKENTLCVSRILQMLRYAHVFLMVCLHCPTPIPTPIPIPIPMKLGSMMMCRTVSTEPIPIPIAIPILIPMGTVLSIEITFGITIGIGPSGAFCSFHRNQCRNRE